MSRVVDCVINRGIIVENVLMQFHINKRCCLKVGKWLL
jgi:hypothetical protein